MKALHRPPKSAAEITALPPIGTTQCHGHVREHGRALSAETLVYIMREAILVQDTALFQLAGSFLLGRPAADDRWVGGHCEPIIAKLAFSFHFVDLEHAVDFRSRCIEALMQAVHDGSDQKGYWEERFFDAFRKTCIDAARSIAASDAHYILAPGGGEADDDWLAIMPDPASDSVEDDTLAAVVAQDRDSRLLNAVRALPPRQAHAVFLRYFEGLPIAGNGSRTVMSVLDISETAANKLLAKARARLRANPKLQGIWPEGY